jgi:hypothetical protein
VGGTAGFASRAAGRLVSLEHLEGAF